MEINEKIVDPKFWGAFKIPAYTFALIALLLVMRNVNSSLEYSYIQHTANYAIGQVSFRIVIPYFIQRG